MHVCKHKQKVPRQGKVPAGETAGGAAKENNFNNLGKHK